jgi:hypothetical protein
MSDPRIKPLQPMTDGTYVVPVQIVFTIDGDGMAINDHSDMPIGDACAALHVAALKEIGGLILEARNTDRFEHKPDDPDRARNSSENVEQGKNG